MKGILLDGDLKFIVVNGSLAIGKIDKQAQKILMLSNKGEFKENPTRGVGAIRYIETADPQGLAREIRTDFKSDGMTVNTIKVTDDFQTEIDAYYES